jgi:ABC-2 type transport system ATP-binding protein
MTIEGPADAVREKLAGIDGVLSIQAGPQENNAATYVVESKLNSDLRKVLAAAVVSQGWGLLELRSVSMSLEDVFINLVTKESA